MDHDGRIDVPCAARGAGERSERSSGGGVLPRFLLGFLVVAVAVGMVRGMRRSRPVVFAVVFPFLSILIHLLSTCYSQILYYSVWVSVCLVLFSLSLVVSDLY